MFSMWLFAALLLVLTDVIDSSSCRPDLSTAEPSTLARGVGRVVTVTGCQGANHTFAMLLGDDRVVLSFSEVSSS